MQNFIKSISAVLILFILVGCYCCEPEPAPPAPPPPPPLSAMVSIAPIIQQTTVWCWAASAQMVLGYYGYPAVNPLSPQCGIVGAYFGGQCAYDCISCTTPIGPMSNEQYVINNYGRFLSGYFTQYYPSISSALVFRALSMNEIKTEISNNRPIIIGIAPGGGWALPNASQHIAVLIGYDNTNGANEVVVNDPYPFWSNPSLSNPYVLVGATSPRLGQYKLSYVALVQQLFWANSIYNMHTYY